MTQTYSPTTALLVVDVQDDFVLPDGALAVPSGEEVVPVVNAEVDAAVDAGALVVYTQDWHPGSTPHFDTDGGPWPVHCVAGTQGAELVGGLRVVGPPEDRDGEPVRVRKGVGTEDGYSGFSQTDLADGSSVGTGLAERLEAAGVRRLVVVGLAGDWCVKATAVDGARAGFEVVVPLVATRFVMLSSDDDVRAREEMEAAGVAVV